jgi:WD40 repeat protein
LVWNIKVQEKNNKQIYKIEVTHDVRDNNISCVAWAPNGEWFASCSSKDNCARIFDVKSKRTDALICELKKHQA